MPNRQAAQELNLRTALQPTAAPVNTTILPAQPQKSGLWDLVQTLQQVNPALNKWAGIAEKYQEKQDKDAVAEGKVAFEKNRMSWKQAVEKGVVDEGANPHFRRGWRLSELQNQGRDYGFELRKAYETSDVRGSDDPQQLAQFTDQFTSKWLADNVGDTKDTAEVAEALLPQIKANQAVLYQRHTEARIADAEAGYRDQLGQSVAGVLSDAIKTGHEFDPAVVAPRLQELADEAYKNGMRPGSQAGGLTKIMVDSVVAHAVEAGDMDVLETLQHVKTGTGVLGSTTYAREQVSQAKETIANNSQSQERFGMWRLEKVRDETDRQVTTQAFQKLHSGNFDVAPEIEMALKAGLPKTAKEIQQYRDSMVSSNARVEELPEDVYAMNQMIYDDPDHGEATIRQFAFAHKISPTRVAQAMDDLRRVREQGVLTDPLVKQVGTDIVKLVTKDDNDPEQMAKATNLRLLYTTTMSDFAEEYRATHGGKRPPTSLMQKQALTFYNETLKNGYWMNSGQPDGTFAPGSPPATAAPAPSAPPKQGAMDYILHGKKPQTAPAPTPQAAPTAANPFDQFHQ